MIPIKARTISLCVWHTGVCSYASQTAKPCTAQICNIQAWRVSLNRLAMRKNRVLSDTTSTTHRIHGRWIYHIKAFTCTVTCHSFHTFQMICAADTSPCMQTCDNFITWSGPFFFWFQLFFLTYWYFYCLVAGTLQSSLEMQLPHRGTFLTHFILFSNYILHGRRNSSFTSEVAWLPESKGTCRLLLSLTPRQDSLVYSQKAKCLRIRQIFASSHGGASVNG